MKKAYEVPQADVVVFAEKDLLELSLGGKGSGNPGQGDPIDINW